MNYHKLETLREKPPFFLSAQTLRASLKIASTGSLKKKETNDIMLVLLVVTWTNGNKQL